MKKYVFIVILLTVALTSCGKVGEYVPDSTGTQSDTENPTNYAPDTTDKGGLTIDDHSLDGIPLEWILSQMLDRVDYDFEDEYTPYKIDITQFKDTFSAEQIDISASEDVLYYGPGEKKPDFALILARMAEGTDMAEYQKSIESAARSASERDGKKIEIVTSHTGRIMFILFAEEGVIGDEDMATLLGSFASVDAEKYDKESGTSSSDNG